MAGAVDYSTINIVLGICISIIISREALDTHDTWYVSYHVET